MNTKLTLRMDEALIRRAKQHAEDSGKSVSQVVANFFSLIDIQETVPGSELTPRVLAMIGSLRGATATEDDHRRHLEEKYPVKVLFDTNVVLDVLLAREPHVDAAAKLFALVDNGRLEGSISATTVTTIYYIAAKSFGRRRAHGQVHALLELFDVAHVGRDVLDRALEFEFGDFEDAVAHEAARASGMAAIVTRDGGDFANATLPVFTPHELLAVIAALPA